MAAEATFRDTIARFAHTGSPVWRLAQECALTATNPSILNARAGGTDIQHAYPETVAFAELILAPDFLAMLLDAALPRTDRLTEIRARVAPLATGQDPWRAETRLMDLSRDLLAPGGVEKWCLTGACEAARVPASQQSSGPKAPRPRATGPTAVAS